MAKKEHTFGIIGVGGYARVYLGATEHLAELGRGRLVAAAVRSPQKYAEKMAELEQQGVRFHPDLPTMLREEALDVVCVPTGISSHVPYSVEAMEGGCDVICEKPLCATVQEAAEMIAARDRLGRKVAIGYQAMYSPVTHELKRRLVRGDLGRVRRIRCKSSAPRPDNYYARNDWAGKQKGSDGRWILDSPANNAIAHQLQQMLFLAGPSAAASGEPARVYAELAHGRPHIDNFDTCAIRVETAEGVALLYLASHCVRNGWGPAIEIECERGTVLITGAGTAPRGATVVRTPDGREEEIQRDPGVPNLAYRAFTNMVGALNDGEELLCTPDNTRQQTLVINAAHDSCGGPAPIDPSFTGSGDVQYGQRVLPGHYIEGGEDALARCYDEWKTFSETGVAWAKTARWIDTAGYEYFPGGKG